MGTKSAGSFLRDTWATLRGKPASFPSNWSTLTGKPSTYPPTLPIAQSDVAGLVNALAGKATPTDITNAINALVNGAPVALDTLKEIADRFAIEDTEQDAMLAAIANRLRIDAIVSYTTQQQGFGRSNLGLGSAATRDETYFLAASAAVQPATAAPIAAGATAAVGTSLKYAREDHRHPPGVAANGNELLGTFNIAETGLVLLALGVRRVNVAVAGAVVGGNYNIYPVNAIPAGFGIVDCVCTVAGTISFGMLVPAITGNYSIPVRVVKVNT